MVMDHRVIVCLFIRLDPIISHVPVQELKLSAVRFAVDSQVILPQNQSVLDSEIGLHFYRTKYRSQVKRSVSGYQSVILTNDNKGERTTTTTTTTLFKIRQHPVYVQACK